MDRELFDKALAVRERAHAPYSKFSVGAALRTKDGSVHIGCNVENAAFPEGWCAETSALADMIAHAPDGRRSRVAAIAVIARRIEGRLVTPCGGCRQRLAEFGGADTLVHVADSDGEGETYLLTELLPHAFALDGPK